MKLRYLFSMILSSLMLFSACQKENTESWDNIKLSATYLSIPEEGGTAELTVTATEDWAFVEAAPEWLTVDKTSGKVGETVVTFSAEATTSGREAELQIKAGDNTQYIRVRQGSMTVTEATVAEVIAGPEGKLYQVTGVCTAIANTTYGNWYLKDDSTDQQIYVYGTVNGDGKYDWASFNIEVGDVVTVQGSYVLYSGTTPEFVDATFISVEKALVKIEKAPATVAKEGAEIEVKVSYKGDGIFPTVPEEHRSWISVVDMQQKAGEPTKIEPNPADTAVVKIAVQPNAGGNRAGSVTFVSSGSSVPYEFTQEGAIIETTADQLNAAADGETLYRLTGVVTSIKSATYGNIYIADYTGEVYVYGTYDADGNRFDTFTTPIEVGDIVTVCGVKTSYNGSPQMKNVVVENHIQVTPATVEEFIAAPESKDVYYLLTGTVSGINDSDIYGNVYLTDETNEVYVYGVLAGWGGPKKEFQTLLANTGLANGDKLTIVGVRSGYNGTPQVGSAFYVSHEAGSAGGEEGGEEPETPVEPEVTTLTLTNAEIVAAMTSSETSYVEYTIESVSGTWTVNAQRLAGNTFLQCRGRKGSYIKTPAFEKDIKSVTLHFSEAKSVYSDNVYCAFPATWVAPSEDAAYPEEGNVGRAVTDGSYSVTIPVNAGNKQVCVSLIRASSYYIDHIDVAF